MTVDSEMYWRTIDTAPRGNLYFLAYTPFNNMTYMVLWREPEWDEVSTEIEVLGRSRFKGEFTHWMPLPRSPKIASEGDK